MSPSPIGLSLHTGDFEIDRAFRIALGDLLGNVIPYRSGLLDESAPCLVAGLSYPDPWTRDAAINTWNGAGLLLPEVMKNTLLCCLTRGDATAGMGHGCEDVAGSQVPAGVLSIGGQYWDRVIWVIGGWNYYCQTGDREFLVTALEATRNTLPFLEANEFDEDAGLFRGGACFHDGIGAYSDIYAEQSGTAIFTWPADNPERRHPEGAGVPLQALSTNCLYAEAYRLAAVMAHELDEAPDPHWAEMRKRVARGIRERLWLEDESRFRFYIDPWGGCGGRHEALGNAFALLFGLHPPGTADAMLRAQPMRDAGPPAIWPDWPRYTAAGFDNFTAPDNRPDIELESHLLKLDPRSAAVYGGHGAACWPFVTSLWADALLRYGDTDAFNQQLKTYAHVMCQAIHSPENIHPDSGLPYGGVQESGNGGPIQRWVCCYRQTWTATGFLRLILRGVLGLTCEPDTLRLAPHLPAGIDTVHLTGLPWRNAALDIVVTRAAGGQTTTTLDGEPMAAPCLQADLQGHHQVVIDVA